MVTVAKKIGVNVLMRASQKGGSGLYLYIERQYAETYGLKPGDRVEVKLIRTFTDVPDARKGVIDLSKGHKRKREDEES